jgi:hypothetical protein
LTGLHLVKPICPDFKHPTAKKAEKAPDFFSLTAVKEDYCAAYRLAAPAVLCYNMKKLASLLV